MNCKASKSCFVVALEQAMVHSLGARGGGERVSAGNRASHTSMSMYLVHNLMNCIPTRHNHAANLHLSKQELNHPPALDGQTS